MRKIIIGIGIGVAAIVVIATAALFLVDVNRYRGAVQSQLERQLGRSVTLGQMHLGILPLRLQVENAVIAEDPAFASQSPFIRADNLDVRVGLSSLTGGNVNVHSLELQRPVVQLFRNKRGEWNFSTLGPASGASKTPSSKEDSARGFALEHIAIHEGRLSVNGFAIDHIDMTSALDGIAEGPLAYLVCGWYADPARDVLGDGITSLPRFEAKIAELGWDLPAGSYGEAGHAWNRIRAGNER